MKFNGTTGPWKLTSDGEANFHGIQKPNGNWLMRVQQNGELSIKEEEANMKLIVAAPELLEALILYREYYACEEVRTKADKAIRKATE